MPCSTSMYHYSQMGMMRGSITQKRHVHLQNFGNCSIGALKSFSTLSNGGSRNCGSTNGRSVINFSDGVLLAPSGMASRAFAQSPSAGRP